MFHIVGAIHSGGMAPMGGNHPEPVVRDLVLIGGGHSHVAVLKSFGMKPMPGVRLTLITRDVHTPYSGMLPGFVAGHYEYDDCHIDLRPLANFAKAQLLHCLADGLDLKEKKVILKDRPPVKYDLLSINIGITPKMAVTGASEFCTPVKPIDTFSASWERVLSRVLAASKGNSVTTIAVVGGGAGGVELLLAMQYRLSSEIQKLGKEAGDLLKFALFSRGGILPSHHPRVGRIFSRILGERGVGVVTSPVKEVTRDAIVCEDTTSHAFDECVWCTQGGAAPWLGATGLDLDDKGFIRIGETLQSTNDPSVFAVGDIHSSAKHPRQKSGVIAVRQGAPLTENLRRALLGKPLLPFVPQSTALALISTGDKYAVASKAFLALEGAWLWSVKDRIDRAFIEKFSNLPVMESPPTPASPVTAVGGPEALEALRRIPMRCGGCGSKVGANVLSSVLARLSSPQQRPEVLVGLDSPDDAAVISVPEGKVLVQTVDFFKSFISDPFTFGQIAANHALGDCYAMGADPVSALALATVPFGIESKVEEDLYQMMAGALLVLEAAGCSLVGGHTSEGPDLSLGFSVTGFADPTLLLRKGGMTAGEVLVLTKPIGTGALFAADMRGRARGRWIDAAVAMMLVSNARASRIVREHGARAATDVTGFGLVGHALEMAKASGVDLRLDLEEIPVLSGALEVVQSGTFSSLHPSNLRLSRAISNIHEVAEHDKYPLLFDPQTAGGLLASVPEDRSVRCLQALREAGCPEAAVVGQVLPTREGGETSIIVSMHLPGEKSHDAEDENGSEKR